MSTSNSDAAVASRGEYAVVRTGGKQYVVSPGKKVTVDALDVPVGEVVSLGEVLLIGGGTNSPRVGAPLLEGASVRARVVGHVKGKKVIIFKKRNRHGYTKKQGHRQLHTELVIDSISA